ncbi:hypothetical protein D3C79_635480 [compost metagenome]
MQGIEPEHGERQQHEHDGEADQHIGVLQRGLELQAGRGDDQPEQGVGDRHPLHIDEGEQEGAAGGEVLTGTGDDAGQNGVHGEDAGGEGKSQPQRKEGGDAEPEALAAEGGRQSILLAAGWRLDGVSGAGLPGGVTGGSERLHGDQLVGGRIAETLGATLIAYLEAGGVPHLGQGDGDLQLLIKDPCLAEEVILMFGACRQHGRLEGEVVPLDADAVAIEIVTVGEAQGQQQLVSLLLALEGEGLVDFQKFGLGIGLDAETAEQILAAGLDGGREQAQQEQQGGKQAKQCHEVSCVNQSR